MTQPSTTSDRTADQTVGDAPPQSENLPDEVRRYLETHPDTRLIDAFLTDLNGIPRGKRLPRSYLHKLFTDGLCLPASTVALDIWGNEVLDSGLLFETGDADCRFVPVRGSLRPQPWCQTPTAQLLLQVDPTSTGPHHGDPRRVLASVVHRLIAMGLTPVVAVEMEFRLFDAVTDAGGRPRLPPSQRTGQTVRSAQLYGFDGFHEFEETFDHILRACEAQNVPVETMIAEQAPAHYEINLRHGADAVLAVDQAILLKRTIKNVASRHGLTACFMAKPFGDEPGNGMHIHFSLVDKDSRNVFDDDQGGDTVQLRQAVAGLLATMEDATAVFAPHANSYRRFQTHAHVPMAPTWGYDNRTVAVRVPLSNAGNTHIEHRVAGADANPYLVLAAVLAGAHAGIRQTLEPPAATEGDADSARVPTLPHTWSRALALFERSATLKDYLGADHVRVFTACKRQEIETFKRMVTLEEYHAYIKTV